MGGREGARRPNNELDAVGFLLSYHSSGKRGCLWNILFLLRSGNLLVKHFVHFILVALNCFVCFFWEVKLANSLWSDMKCVSVPTEMYGLLFVASTIQISRIASTSCCLSNCFVERRKVCTFEIVLSRYAAFHRDLSPSGSGTTRTHAHEHTDKTKHEINAKFGPLDWCCKQRGGACALSV